MLLNNNKYFYDLIIKELASACFLSITDFTFVFKFIIFYKNWDRLDYLLGLIKSPLFRATSDAEEKYFYYFLSCRYDKTYKLYSFDFQDNKTRYKTIKDCYNITYRCYFAIHIDHMVVGVLHRFLQNETITCTCKVGNQILLIMFIN